LYLVSWCLVFGFVGGTGGEELVGDTGIEPDLPDVIGTL
jgi:hypothetical protein